MSDTSRQVDNPLASTAIVSKAGGEAGVVAVEQQRAIAEVQAAVLVARGQPRDAVRAMELILQDCQRPSLAENALYQYSRGGTDINGASIRLAENIARRWGNVECGVLELSRRDGYSECLAYAWDLETNFRDRKQFQVKHWRDTKNGGYRISDERDIYELVANMGARRKRACILAVIPGDVVEAALAQCESTLKAKADTSPEAMQKMVEAFEFFGVSRKMIETRIQRSLDSIAPAQVVGLKKVYASLRDGMGKVSDFFEAEEGAAAPAGADVAAAKSRATQLAEKALAMRKAAESASTSASSVGPLSAGSGRNGAAQAATADPGATQNEAAEAIDRATGEITPAAPGKPPRGVNRAKANDLPWESSEAPQPTTALYPRIMDAINKAASVEAVDEAVDLARGIDDIEQVAEIVAAGKARKRELT